MTQIQKQAFFVVQQGETKDNRNNKIDNSHTQFFSVKRVINYVILIKLLFSKLQCVFCATVLLK